MSPGAVALVSYAGFMIIVLWALFAYSVVVR